MAEASGSVAKSSGGGIGFTTLLGLLFIALKLTGYIDWSWWWVLAPFWLPPTVLIVGLLAVLAFCGIAWLFCAVMVWLADPRR